MSNWKEMADRLAQRLRSLPESGTSRFPDARDRDVLKDYDMMCYPPGMILVNTHGLKIRVVRMVERGAVVVYGDTKEFVHESLCEWDNLKTYSPLKPYKDAP